MSTNREDVLSETDEATFSGSDAVSDSNFDSGGDSVPDSEPDKNGDRDTASDSNSDGDSDSDNDSDSDRDSDSNSNSDRDSDSNSNSDRDSDSNSNSDADSDSYSDSDSNTDSDTPDIPENPKFYFVAGAWHGYGESTTGEVEGGEINPLTSGFTSGEGEVCVSGTLAMDYSSLGTIAMTFIQDKDGNAEEWVPGDAYGGINVDITKNIDTNIRFVLEGSDGKSYCADNVAAGESLIRWSRFKTECWWSDGVAYDPAVGFTGIKLYAPGDRHSEVTFDYCLEELNPIATEDMPKGPITHEMFVGNITTMGNVRSDFVQYWDQITPENEGKWSSVEGSRDHYNWRGVDRVYNYARENNILFKQHTFVWGNQSPRWIENLSPTEQAEEIEEWIRDFCARYPDTELIDVVNEATPGHAPAGYAKSAFGDDWIIKAFELARTYCPNSILILNDYNVLTWNTDEFIEMATPAVNAGVVDAIGLQSHGLADWNLSDLENNFNKVAALGLPIYITEYDADVADDQRQKEVVEEQFTFFYTHPQVVGITLWGYIYGSTWVSDSGLIRHDGSFRPAMTWLMDYLGK